MRRISVAAVICLLWPSLALGQGSTHPANDRGERLLKQGRPAAAYYEFRKALQATGDFRVHYKLGICQRARQRPVEALCAFERFLDGADGPAAADLSPAERRRVEKASEEVEERILPPLREKASVVRVTVSPPEAEVLVNGSKVDELPVCGNRGETFTIEAHLEGYRSDSETITFPHAGELTPIHLELLPAPARLSVESAVAGAQVVIDDVPVGAAPWSGDMEPGDHNVEVRAEGHEPATRQVSLEVGQEVSLTLDPARPAVEPDPASERARLSPVWFWSTASLALAAGIGSVVTGVLASQRHAEFDEYLDAVEAGSAHGSQAEQLAEAEELRDEGQSLTLATDILWITASASAAAAVILAFFTRFGGGDESAPNLEAGATFAPGGGVTFSARGRF